MCRILYAVAQCSHKLSIFVDSFLQARRYPGYDSVIVLTFFVKVLHASGSVL